MLGSPVRIFFESGAYDDQLRMCGYRHDNGAEHDELAIGPLSKSTMVDAINSARARESVLGF